MNNAHFFVTGAMGCVGAWVVRNLVKANTAVTAFDLSENKHRLKLIMSDEEIEQVNFVQGDITDTEVVKTAVLQSNATHIIHLAALQVPFCKANPPVGAAVNVVGSVNVFEAAKAVGIKQLVYASSIAVYGHKNQYPKLLPHDAPPAPLNHYGVFKLANEGTARIYWQDDGIASIGLRPYTIYGPARDQGMTSTPTKAMLAAARGEPYHISFGGSNGFQYTDDIANTFIKAAYTPFRDAAVFNIRGSVVHMRDVIAAIEAAEPSAKGRVTFEDTTLPFPEGQEETALLSLLGEIPYTPLNEGVARTIAQFKTVIANGRLSQP
ncbi:MAG: NAD(P)-dependent oxidoreductase [Chloroflexi bacterium]|nr:NAD(P)-dependent oxidoreductase [Chloroflexota bacterium]